jgi:hypothetical protein
VKNGVGVKFRFRVIVKRAIEIQIRFITPGFWVEQLEMLGENISPFSAIEGNIKFHVNCNGDMLWHKFDDRTMNAIILTVWQNDFHAITGSKVSAHHVDSK